jgi:hypothetical protein
VETIGFTQLAKLFFFKKEPKTLALRRFNMLMEVWVTCRFREAEQRFLLLFLEKEGSEWKKK